MKSSLEKAIDEYQAIMYQINTQRHALMKQEMKAWERLEEALNKDRPEYTKVHPAYPYLDF